MSLFLCHHQQGPLKTWAKCLVERRRRTLMPRKKRRRGKKHWGNKKRRGRRNMQKWKQREKTSDKASETRWEVLPDMQLCFAYIPGQICYINIRGATWHSRRAGTPNVSGAEVLGVAFLGLTPALWTFAACPLPHHFLTFPGYHLSNKGHQSLIKA